MPENRKNLVSKICPGCQQEFKHRPDRKGVTCSKSCARKLDAIKNGGHSYNYNGGRTKINSGYWKVLKRDHPRADDHGYVLEHILVMEEILGRYLLYGENVHHKNGQRDDNRPENLELWTTKQPFGARVDDLLDWVVERYPNELKERLNVKYSNG